MPLSNPAPLPPNYIEGFHTSAFGFVGDHYMWPGRARSDDNTMDLVILNRILIGQTVGVVNGIDAGGPGYGAGWWYHYVIGDDSGVNPTGGLASMSSTSPTLPTGYTKKRRTGQIWSGRFLMTQGSLDPTALSSPIAKPGNEREYTWNPYHSEATFRALTGGTATVYTTISLASLVPSITGTWRRVKLLSVITTTDLNDAVYYTLPGSHANALFRHVAGDSSAGTTTSSQIFDMPIGDSCNIEYKCVPAAGGAVSATLSVIGFTDQV